MIQVLLNVFLVVMAVYITLLVRNVNVLKIVLILMDMFALSAHNTKYITLLLINVKVVILIVFLTPKHKLV